jgi:hypothetical protein
VVYVTETISQLRTSAKQVSGDDYESIGIFLTFLKTGLESSSSRAALRNSEFFSHKNEGFAAGWQQGVH